MSTQNHFLSGKLKIRIRILKWIQIMATGLIVGLVLLLAIGVVCERSARKSICVENLAPGEIITINKTRMHCLIIRKEK